jgi:sulfur carrier protein ThiS
MKTLIDLRLFATLAQYLPAESGKYAIPEDATVLDVIRSLGIPETEVKLAFVNSVQVPVDTVLNGGDRLGLFPPVGGG